MIPARRPSPAMKSKVIWTTIVASVVFAFCWVIYVYKLVTLEELGTLWGLLSNSLR